MASVLSHTLKTQKEESLEEHKRPTTVNAILLFFFSNSGELSSTEHKHKEKRQKRKNDSNNRKKREKRQPGNTAFQTLWLVPHLTHLQSVKKVTCATCLRFFFFFFSFLLLTEDERCEAEQFGLKRQFDMKKKDKTLLSRTLQILKSVRIAHKQGKQCKTSKKKQESEILKESLK